MDLTPSVKELLFELFLEPFIGDLFDLYEEKSYENKMMVELLIECTKAPEMYFQIISLLEPRVKKVNSDPYINALESLYQLYHNKIDLSSVYKGKLNQYQLVRYLDEQYAEQIKIYYGDNPSRTKTMMLQTFNNEVEKCISFALKHDNCIVNSIMSKKIKMLRKYMDLPTIDVRGGVNFSYCDFSGKDLSNRLMTSWEVSNCKFVGTKFAGNGTTNTCIHWTARNCDFTDAIFNGNICNKTSIYDGSNFTRVNLSTIMYNCGEVTMKNCNFTDAYVIVDSDNKLMGKELIKYLTETKRLDTSGSFYTSPRDTGYDAKELNDKIWIEI